uniref:Methyl-accepting chemotaxis sensory transducer with Pas/Pac sensor n=1 Tax=Nitratidesulfovibrio vulgaris (strain DSM 19637 / Miyazaki F) TaxID=883 RepID=B8DR86_NITV9
MSHRLSSVRARILLLAACGIVATGLVAAIALHAMSAIRADFTRVTQHSLAGKVATLSIGKDLNYVSRLTRNIMLGSNLEKDLVGLERTAASIREGFRALNRAADNDEVRRKVAEAEDSTMQFVEDGMVFVRGLAKLPPAERHQRYPQYQASATPLAEASRKHFDALVTHADASYAESLARFEHDLAAGRTRVLLLSAGVVAALLLLGWAIVRAIVRPLDRATAYARAVEGGRYDDLTEDEARAFSGEVGTLVGAMRAMVAQIRQRIGFAQGVLRSLPVPCVILNTDGTVQWANDALAALSGRGGTGASLVGQPGARALPTPHAAAICDDALRRNQLRRADLPLDDEGERGADMTACPVHDLDGNPLGVMACLVDVSELRRQQRLVMERNEALAEAADNAGRVGGDVVDAARRVDESVRESLRRSDMQQARTAEVSVAVEQMNATVAEVARGATDAAGSADEALRRADEGRAVVQRAVAAIAEVDETARNLRAEMGDLAGKAEGIGRIAGVISDIADQTNLLALNAAIEAARAGDAGRGFAVVADEVRKLAEKTMTATREVEEFVRAIRESSGRSVRATEETTAIVGRATQLASGAGEALAAIHHIATDTADRVRAIATASEQQSAASEQIARSTTEIRGAADETGAALRGIGAAMDDVRRMSADLAAIVAAMQN